MKLLNVKFIEETSVAVYAEVEYKYFWSGKIKKEIVYIKKHEGIDNKIVLDTRFVMKKNNDRLFGFESIFLICVANSIDEVTAFEIVRVYENEIKNISRN